jgi:hypothetical protein
LHLSSKSGAKKSLAFCRAFLIYANSLLVVAICYFKQKSRQ